MWALQATEKHGLQSDSALRGFQLSHSASSISRVAALIPLRAIAIDTAFTPANTSSESSQVKPYAEQCKSRSRECEHVAIGMRAVCMGCATDVTRGAYALIVWPCTPYTRRRSGDLHVVIGGLKRLQTQAELREARPYGTCEAWLAREKAVPLECG